MYRGWERERGGQRGIISIYLSQKKLLVHSCFQRWLSVLQRTEHTLDLYVNCMTAIWLSRDHHVSLILSWQCPTQIHILNTETRVTSAIVRGDPEEVGFHLFEGVGVCGEWEVLCGRYWWMVTGVCCFSPMATLGTTSQQWISALEGEALIVLDIVHTVYCYDPPPPHPSSHPHSHLPDTTAWLLAVPSATETEEGCMCTSTLETPPTLWAASS